eukprot:COSAG06_NODE_16_length_34949_cov_31.500832_18_plen_73_part_00
MPYTPRSEAGIWDRWKFRFVQEGEEQARKTPSFRAIVGYYKLSFYQDRLGTNIPNMGKVETRVVAFCNAGGG